MKETILQKYDHENNECKRMLRRREDCHGSATARFKLLVKGKRHKAKSKHRDPPTLKAGNDSERTSDRYTENPPRTEDSSSTAHVDDLSRQLANAPLVDHSSSAINSTIESIKSDDGSNLEEEELEFFDDAGNECLDEQVLHPTAPVCASSAMDSVSELSVPQADGGNSIPPSSNHGDEVWGDSAYGYLSEITALDFIEVRIPYNSRLSANVDVNLSSFYCSERKIWKFCTRSLVIDGNGDAELMLQKPCSGFCEHISIHAENFTEASGKGSPQAPQVFPCSTPPRQETSSTIGQDSSVLRCIVTDYPRSENLQTQIFQALYVKKWVVAGSELSTFRITILSTQDAHESEATNVLEDESERTAKQKQFANTPEKDNPKKRPCLLCGPTTASNMISGKICRGCKMHYGLHVVSYGIGLFLR